MSSLKILHVEDDEGQARLLQKRLAKMGHTVDWAKDGVEGLDMFSRNTYDIVVLDYNMPQKSGFEVMKSIISTDNAPPVVFLTASGDEKLAVEAMKHGASDYLVKDVTLGYLELLPTVINNALYKKQLAEEKRRAEKELREANERLEERVIERTRELATANARLEEEIVVRKQAEQENKRLAAAMEQAADVVVITDISGDILYANPAFEKATGYSFAEVVGKNPRILKSEKHDEAFYKNLWDTINSGQIWHSRLMNKRKDGTFYEEEMTISPVKDSHGNITNFVAVKHDITAEASLARARDYFVAITSHELRTPLNRLELSRTIFTETLKDNRDALIEKAMTALFGAIASFERIISASEIFRDIALTGHKKPFSEIRAGHLIAESVEAAVGKLKYEKRDVEIRTSASMLDNIVLLCDPALLQRAFDEIISNAVKYTPDGRAVTITGKVDGEFGVVEVADEGSGMDMAKKEMALEPYFSFNDPLLHFTSQYKYMGGGLGMGLTLAKLIMKRHGGSLDIQSSSAGTVVSLVFRLRPEE